MLMATALGTFANITLMHQQSSLYQYELYDKADVSIPNYFGFTSLHINIIDICSNAVQILAIFSLKQLIATIRQPKNATLIKINPLIVYADEQKGKVDGKNAKFWKFIAIAWWTICLLIWCIASFLFDGKVLMLFMVTFIVSILLLHIIASPKALYASSIIVLVLAFFCVIGSYLFGWASEIAFLCFFGFGLTAAHALKVISTPLYAMYTFLIFFWQTKAFQEKESKLTKPIETGPKKEKKDVVENADALENTQEGSYFIQTETVKKYEDVDRQQSIQALDL